MRKLIINNILQNKKTSIIFLFSIIISSMLIFVFIFLFSSGHKYIVNEVAKNTGNYHVKIKTNLQNYENFSVIKKVKWTKDEVLITYNDINLVYDLTNKLCQKTKCFKVEYNEAYLSLYGVSKNNNFLKTFKNLLFIILSIILIASFLIIYNIYKIVLIAKLPQISILQSIGMTLKELKKILLVEALIFSLIGIIIGFILSILLTLLLICIINNILKLDFNFIINIKFLFYAFLFLFILIIFICLIPFFKASKINNLKLLNINYKHKENKKFKNIIFYLAYLNYKRSKNHYKSLIISLIVFIILASSFNLFLSYSTNIINKYVTMPSYDAEVTILENNEQNYKLLKNFADKNSSKYKIYEVCNKKVSIEENNFIKKGNPNLNVYIIKDNNYFINKSKSIIIKNNKIYQENKKYLKNTISLKIDNKELKLKASNNIPFGFENILTKDNLLIGIKDNLCKTKLTLFMKSKNNNLEKELNKLAHKDIDLYYVNAEKGKLMVNNIILFIKTFLYSILLLVLLIGISTIISSSYLSIMYRKKEFGLLKSIGFTNKNFKDMIVVESLYITFKAFLWSLPIILFINMFIVNSINAVIDIDKVSIFKPFLLYTLISLLIVRFVMRICYRKVENKTILNLINKDNI